MSLYQVIFLPILPNLDYELELVIEEIREPTPVPPTPEPPVDALKKALEGAGGKMENNRITSGPLSSRENLRDWLSSIYWTGHIMHMFATHKLLHPRHWLGGGKSSGKNNTNSIEYCERCIVVMQWLRSEYGRKLVMSDRQIIKSSCTKYRHIFGMDVSNIEFDD